MFIIRTSIYVYESLVQVKSGYYSFKHKKPSSREKFKEIMEDKTINIYDKSHKNYGALKITQKLREIGEEIRKKTVRNYIKELGIKVQYVKPYTATTTDSDFSSELKNILDYNLSKFNLYFFLT